MLLRMTFEPVTSNVEDSLCTVYGDDEEEEDIEMNDDITYSSDESCVDNDAMCNSFSTFTNKFMPVWYKHIFKLIHDCAQVNWKLSAKPIIKVDAK